MTLAKLMAKKISQEKIEAEIRTLLSDFSSLSGLEKMILFGSAVRNEMTEASDLDVVLLFDSKENAKSASKVVHSERSSHWPADLLCVDMQTYDARSQVGGVLFVARTEGRTIFEKNK